MQWNTVITGIVYFQNMITLYLKTVLIKCLKGIKCCILDAYSLKGVFSEALSRIFALFWPMLSKKKFHYHLASFFFKWVVVHDEMGMYIFPFDITGSKRNAIWAAREYCVLTQMLLHSKTKITEFEIPALHSMIWNLVSCWPPTPVSPDDTAWVCVCTYLSHCVWFAISPFVWNACNTHQGAWIFTEGLREGVGRCVGEAVRDHATAASSVSNNKVIAIGIPSWGLVHNRQQLINPEVLVRI